MPAVYLTPASISYLNQVILASLISAYLLRRFLRTGARGRTAADWMLLAIFVTVILMSAAFFFEVTLLGVGTYAAVAVETGLTVLLFAVLIWFSYSFPQPIGTKLEKQIAMAVCGGYVAFEVAYAVWRLQIVGRGQIAYASDSFDLSLIIGAVWIIANFIRGGLKDGGDRAARRLALVFCIPLVLALINLAYSIGFVTAPAYYIALTTGLPLTLYLFTLSYLAAKPEATSLAVRVLGAMITGQLAILGILGWLVAPQYARGYQPAIVDHRSLRFDPLSDGGYRVEEIPLAYQPDIGVRVHPEDPTRALSDTGGLPFASVFFGQSYDDVYINTDGSLSFGAPLSHRFLQISLTHQPAIFAMLQSYGFPADSGIYVNRDGDRLVVSYVNVASYYYPQHRATFQIVLTADGSITLTTYSLPEQAQYFINDRPDAAPWALGITPGGAIAAPIDFNALPTVIGAEGGIQDEYLAFRQAIHTLLLPFTLGSLVVGLVFLGIFAVMVHLSLTVQLDNLISGVKGFRRSGGAIHLPVLHNDEIGFLTDTFNTMSVELGALIHDLEERVAARTADLSTANLQLSKLSTAVEQSADAIVITDLKGRIEYVNHAFCEATGYSAEEALGQNPRILKSADTPPEVYRDLWATLARGETWSGDLLNTTKTGELLWESAVISPIRSSSGAVTHYVAVKENITERKRAEQERERLIALDPLTGLYNRRYFFETGEALFGQGTARPPRLAALMLDIDHFKSINDTFGHQGGDTVLREVAERLATHLRASELLARYGGEEFAVLLTQVEPVDVADIATRLVQGINATPIAIDDVLIKVSISLGAAYATDDTASLDALLSHADRALYEAKRLGRNRWEWWTNDRPPMTRSGTAQTRSL